MTKQNKGRKLFAVSASAALVASAIVPVASAAAFTDQEQIASWATEYVDYVVENGYMKGNEDGTFAPTGTFTRAQAAQVIVNYLDLDTEDTEAAFADVEEGAWYYGAVNAVAAEGLVNGVGNGNFAPEQPLTRQDAAKLFGEVLGLDAESADLSSLDQFNDADDIAEYAAGYIALFVDAEVINGKGEGFDPTGLITRQELAKIVALAIQAFGEEEVDEVAEALAALETAKAALEEFGEITEENYEEAQGLLDDLNEAIAALEALDLEDNEEALEALEAAQTLAEETAATIEELVGDGGSTLEEQLAEAAADVLAAATAAQGITTVDTSNVEAAQDALDTLTAALETLNTLIEENEVELSEENAALLAQAEALVAALTAKIEAVQVTTDDTVKVESVNAVNPTTIQVTFSGDITEEQANKDNFTLSKGTVEAVKVEGKVATISVKGLTYGDATTVTVGNPAHTATVTIPEVSELYILEVTTDAADDTIKSDGAAKTQITVTLKDRKTGEIVDKDGVVQFQATRGGLGQTTSALQDGKATVQLTSVASATSMTSILTATVSDVPGAAEFEGLTAQKAVIFSPDAVEAETNFVQALAAESTQGDRLHVSFSDKISAADYKKAIADTAAIKGKPTSKEYKINIDGKAVAVKDVVQVTDNTLEFILDVDSETGGLHARIEDTIAWRTSDSAQNYLRDNVTHTVTFPQNVGGVVLATTAGIKFILTDTSRPAVLGVTAQDQLNFTVRFTESVDERTVEGAEENFLIDGRKVVVNAKPSAGDILSAKNQNQVILTSLKVGEYSFDKDGKAVDSRNLVNFKIHKDFALAAGTHQIQIANVGDWAVDVDPLQNTVATDTFDFNVALDTSVPTPTVEVQSPEQWKVSFDKDVYGATGKQIKDVFAIKTADSNDTLVMDTDYIVSYINEDGTKGTQLSSTNPASELDGQRYFLIEFTADWTEKYGTQTNPDKTYFASTKNPYVVTIDALESAIGNKVSKQDLNVRLSYDGQSPEIAVAKQIEDKGVLTNGVRVQMTEPVKNVVVSSNNEGLTPSQQQIANAGVPVPTYEFVKGDKVVKAIASAASYDNYGFTLTPESDLEAGEWTLYIRSISDDIGNTSATVSAKVIIQAAAQQATSTQISWAAFDDSNAAAVDPLTQNDNKLLNLAQKAAYGNSDVIYVKFTKVMKADGANGVSRTQNYVFGGQPLPAGSQVLKGIHGVTTDWDGVTIVMPKGSWDGAANALNDFGRAFNVANNFTSATGELLSGAYEVELKDTTTASATLVNGFEALYKAANAGTFGDAQATIKGAEATDVDANGKIDQVTLNFEELVTLTDKAEIRVNGKTFVISGNTTSTSAVFNAKDATNQVDGTTTNGLTITSVEGAILVNKDSVVDAAAPVVKASALSGTKLKVTFSEAINVTTSPVVFADVLAVTGSSVTASDAEEVGTDYLVFDVGTTLSGTPTIDVLTAGSAVVEDKAGNDAIAIEGATTTNDVKITGIAGSTPGSTVTGVTATSATQTQAGLTGVTAGSANAADIGLLEFAALENELAGYKITVVEDTAGTGVVATLNVSTKEITVKVEDLAQTGSDVQTALRALETVFDGVGLADEADAIALIEVNGTADTEGTTTIVAGTPGVTAKAATVKFTVTSGATKSGNITVTIKETSGSPATTVTTTLTVPVTAGLSKEAIAEDIYDAITAGGTYVSTFTGADVTVAQAAGNEAPATITVTIQ